METSAASGENGSPLIPELTPQPIRPEKTWKQRLLGYLDFFLDLVLIFLLVWFVRTYILSPFQVSGSSMTNTLLDKQFIMVDKWSYHGLLGFHFGVPQRGDIVVLKPPIDRDTYYIKRVIGLPGDTIRFEQNQVVITNKEHPEGLVLDESYLKCNQIQDGQKINTCDYTRLPQKEFTVPDGSYFVMGDNRNNSTDARACFNSCRLPGATPFITLDQIIGKTWFVVWPFHFLETPQYP